MIPRYPKTIVINYGFNSMSDNHSIRGGKIGPTQWASSVHPELGLGWAIK